MTNMQAPPSAPGAPKKPEVELDAMKVQNGNMAVVVRVRWKNLRMARWRARMAMWLLVGLFAIVRRVGGFQQVVDQMRIMREIYAALAPAIDLASQFPGARVQGSEVWKVVYDAYGAMSELDKFT